MTEDKAPKPDGRPEEQAPRRAAPQRRDDSEKALGLEMARLFGISPKMMMAPKPTPKTPPEADDDDEDGQPRG
jgi:hypothetical protein